VTKPQVRIRRLLGRVRRRVRRLLGGPDHAAEIRALRAEMAEVRAMSKRRNVEHSRVTVQMGAFEERMGRLEELLGSQAPVTDGASEVGQDAIRREQEQARVRMQIVSHYEERLRRVEEAVSKLYDGDARHKV
jgi:hypothetical protein